MLRLIEFPKLSVGTENLGMLYDTDIDRLDVLIATDGMSFSPRQDQEADYQNYKLYIEEVLRSENVLVSGFNEAALIDMNDTSLKLGNYIDINVSGDTLRIYVLFVGWEREYIFIPEKPCIPIQVLNKDLLVTDLEKFNTLSPVVDYSSMMLTAGSIIRNYYQEKNLLVLEKIDY